MSAELQQPVTGVKRILYIAVGTAFFVLAMLGAFLPVLPTTPFLLLTSYFFVRSSPALHNRLINSRLFGKLLRDWNEHRGVKKSVKIFSILLVFSVVTATVLFAGLAIVWNVILVALAIVGLVVISSLRTI